VLADRPDHQAQAQAESLIEHADKARLSRELVRLVCDAPLPEPLEALALKGIPARAAAEFLEDQGFKSLLNRCSAAASGRAGQQRRGGINDVMAAMEPKKSFRGRPKDRSRPLEI
jgi:DNA polymerase-1